MRVAVVGCGTMGRMHALLLSRMDGVSEILVCEADAARAAGVAGEVGGRVVAHDAALDAADAVVIATPAHLHGVTVEAAVARGLPALCEKPLTEELASSAALVELVERSGAHVQMGFQRRHDPGFAEARRRIADGTAGQVHLLRLAAFDPRGDTHAAEWWPDGDAAPLFLHSSVHDFDFVRWMTGAEVVELTADGTRHDDSRPADARGIETAVVTMRMSDGSLAVLEATWLHPGGYDIRAEVIAEREHLSMGLSTRTPATHLDWPLSPDEAWTHYLERFEAAYRSELVAFLAAARGERPPASSARDGLEALRIAVAATRSYRERRTVAISEIAAPVGQAV